MSAPACDGTVGYHPGVTRPAVVRLQLDRPLHHYPGRQRDAIPHASAAATSQPSYLADPNGWDRVSRPWFPVAHATPSWVKLARDCGRLTWSARSLRDRDGMTCRCMPVNGVCCCGADRLQPLRGGNPRVPVFEHAFCEPYDQPTLWQIAAHNRINPAGVGHNAIPPRHPDASALHRIAPDRPTTRWPPGYGGWGDSGSAWIIMVRATKAAQRYRSKRSKMTHCRAKGGNPTSGGVV